IDVALRRIPGLINTTRYYTQISPYIKKFGREQVHIVLFDQMIKQPTTVLNDIFHFLGLETIDITESDLGKFHVNKSYRGTRKHHKYKKLKNHLGYKLLRKLLPGLAARIADNSKRHLKQKPKLSLESIELVQNLVEADILMLQSLVDADLSSWLQRTDAILDYQLTKQGKQSVSSMS